MSNNSTTILMISRDAVVCAACRKEFEDAGNFVFVALVSSLEEAQRSAQNFPPAVIVLDEPGIAPRSDGPTAENSHLESAATLLAGIAPVVVIAAPERQSEVAPLLSAGAADFVARAGDFLPVALGFIERRLRQARQDEAGAVAQPFLPGLEGFREEEDFGDVLRHELNNPLTGILGNAELLLAEVRRRNDGRLPQGAQQRLETITDLAVRMREAVRRLSQQWEAHHADARQA
jgi:signal transduction histidine kinase